MREREISIVWPSRRRGKVEQSKLPVQNGAQFILVQGKQKTFGGGGKALMTLMTVLQKERHLSFFLYLLTTKLASYCLANKPLRNSTGESTSIFAILGNTLRFRLAN